MPFNGIHNLRDANESVTLKPWQIQELKKCAKNPIYFIRNYVYINTKDNGMCLMKTYPFQDEAIRRFLKYRFNINRWSRQVGKSTVVRAYILWYAMFHQDKLVAMLANKLTLEDCSAIHTQYSALIYFLYKNGLQDYFTDTEVESLVITEKDGVYTAEVMRGTERPDLVGCGPEGEKVMVRPAGE